MLGVIRTEGLALPLGEREAHTHEAAGFTHCLIRPGRGAAAGTAALAPSAHAAQPQRDHEATRTALRDLIGKGVLQLEAEGRLSLDDTVERWLPGPGAGQRLRR
ncbi:hypothetical protein SVIOM74S_01375 [Streptomyces violarus]